MAESVARLEAEIDRLGTAMDLRDMAMDEFKAEVRKALDLVREAGDCLLLQNTHAARVRIQSAALVLWRVGGESN